MNLVANAVRMHKRRHSAILHLDSLQEPKECWPIASHCHVSSLQRGDQQHVQCSPQQIQPTTQYMFRSCFASWWSDVKPESGRGGCASSTPRLVLGVPVTSLKGWHLQAMETRHLLLLYQEIQIPEHAQLKIGVRVSFRRSRTWIAPDKTSKSPRDVSSAFCGLLSDMRLAKVFLFCPLGRPEAVVLMAGRRRHRHQSSTQRPESPTSR